MDHLGLQNHILFSFEFDAFPIRGYLAQIKVDMASKLRGEELRGCEIELQSCATRQGKDVKQDAAMCM